MFQGNTAVLSAAAIGVAGYLVFLIKATEDVTTVFALTALLAGASGNIADRLFRKPGPLRGEVIDFIALPRWPNFNVADIAVTCGGILLAYSVIRQGRAQRHADDNVDDKVAANE